MTHLINRSTAREQTRTADILRLTPEGLSSALDIGARDGHFSLLLTERFEEVTALDLETPTISHPNVKCVKGNAAALHFQDGCFDFVLCAEVLEHIPSPMLEAACAELARVTSGYLLVGVPYKQDIRVGRTTCRKCGGKNPPWGHVNSFDETRLQNLFPNLIPVQTSFVGSNHDRTNWLSTILMDLAGNPWGTYAQEESCVHCGEHLSPPPKRNIAQKICTRLGYLVRKTSEKLTSPRPAWIHVLMLRRESAVNQIKQ